MVIVASFFILSHFVAFTTTYTPCAVEIYVWWPFLGVFGAKPNPTSSRWAQQRSLFLSLSRRCPTSFECCNITLSCIQMLVTLLLLPFASEFSF
jgi:hypothetical protein